MSVLLSSHNRLTSFITFWGPAAQSDHCCWSKVLVPIFDWDLVQTRYQAVLSFSTPMVYARSRYFLAVKSTLRAKMVKNVHCDPLLRKVKKGPLLIFLVMCPENHKGLRENCVNIMSRCCFISLSRCIPSKFPLRFCVFSLILQS